MMFIKKQKKWGFNILCHFLGQDRHRDVSSFLKFSIQNILQHAASGLTGAGAAAAVAAAASRRPNDLIQADVAAAMTDLDMKRAMGTLPFW